MAPRRALRPRRVAHRDAPEAREGRRALARAERAVCRRRAHPHREPSLARGLCRAAAAPAFARRVAGPTSAAGSRSSSPARETNLCGAAAGAAGMSLRAAGRSVVARMAHARLRTRCDAPAAPAGRRTRGARVVGQGCGSKPGNGANGSPSTPTRRPNGTPRRGHAAPTGLVGRRRPAQRHQASASCSVRWLAACARRRCTSVRRATAPSPRAFAGSVGGRSPPTLHASGLPASVHQRGVGISRPASTKGRNSAQRTACGVDAERGQFDAAAQFVVERGSWPGLRPSIRAAGRRPAAAAWHGGRGAGQRASSIAKPARAPCRARPRGACLRAAAQAEEVQPERSSSPGVPAAAPASRPAVAVVGAWPRRPAGAATSGVVRHAAGVVERRRRCPRAGAAPRGRRRRHRHDAGLRRSTRLWNQPMWPSSHSGGLSSGR